MVNNYYMKDDEFLYDVYIKKNDEYYNIYQGSAGFDVYIGIVDTIDNPDIYRKMSVNEIKQFKIWLFDTIFNNIEKIYIGF